MTHPFPVIIKPIGRQQYRANVVNETPLQEILTQLHDSNLQLYHKFEELIDADDKKLSDFPITINSPFYFIPEKIDYNQAPKIQKLIFHNGNKQKEVRQDGRVITACLSSFFRGPWRLICEGHLISLKELPSSGDVYVEQKTENFIDIEIYGPNLLGSIIFELPKTATISDIYQRLYIRYGIRDKYLFQDGLPVDGPIINYLDERGFLTLQLLTYNGVAVNYKGHSLQRYGFLYRNCTILDLKTLIRNQTKIPVPWITLYFNGSVCENYANVFDFIQSENDSFELITEHGETFQLNINGKSYEVQWDFTISDLRRIVGISQTKKCRSFLGVYSYDPSISVGMALFKRDQVIDAWADDNYRIFLYDTATHEKKEIFVQPGETLLSLRVRISAEKKIDFNAFKFIFMGTQLKDEQTFSGCRIGKNATINLMIL